MIRQTIAALGLALLSAFALALPSWAAEAVLRDVFRIERSGIDSVPDDRLRTLVSMPAPDAGPMIEMSRSWLDRQPEPVADEQLECLAEALYFEARGETVRGQFAVAEVILNRVKSSRFPDDVCAVVRQGTGKRYQCQFTYTCDGLSEKISERDAYDRVAKIARAVLDGRAPSLTEGATHYHTKAVHPNWADVYTKTASIGAHVFYRHTWKTASN